MGGLSRGTRYAHQKIQLPVLHEFVALRLRQQNYSEEAEDISKKRLPPNLCSIANSTFKTVLLHLYCQHVLLLLVPRIFVHGPLYLQLDDLDRTAKLHSGNPYWVKFGIGYVFLDFIV